MEIANYGQTNNQISKGNLYETLSLKVGKISTALYMVTDCLDDSEPMRERLRVVGVRLITLGAICRVGNLPTSHDAAMEIASLAREAASLADVAGIVGLFSEMNASILKTELTRLAEMTEESTPVFSLSGLSTKKSGIVFPENFFSKVELKEEESYIDKDFMSKGHVKDMSFTKQNDVLLKNDEVDLQKNKAKKFDIAQKINRRNSILELVKDKNEVTIKDIASVISDCSEKTIQRELGVLVALGVLRKEGDKRWSKYKII